MGPRTATDPTRIRHARQATRPLIRVSAVQGPCAVVDVEGLEAFRTLCYRDDDPPDGGKAQIWDAHNAADGRKHEHGRRFGEGGPSDSCSVRVLGGCSSPSGLRGLVVRRDPHPDPSGSEVHRGSSVSGLLASQLKALLLFTHMGVGRAEEDDDVVEHRTERTSAEREHEVRLRLDASERPLHYVMGAPLHRRGCHAAGRR